MVEAPVIPPEERTIRESGARRFARVLRERWLIVAITFVAALAVALFYVSVASPTYQADAQLLISPVTDPNLDVLSLLRASSDPSNDTQTAALLVSTPGVAAEAGRLLHSSEDPQTLLKQVHATPVAGSDLVALTATASTPAQAARLANAFAQAGIVVRTRLLQAQVQTAIPRLQALLNALPGNASSTATSSLASELAALRALQGESDPTIALASPAVPPAGRASPRTALSLAAAGILGLLIGIALALVADARDPRLRRESQLQEALDLPVLARLPWVPTEGHQGSDLDPYQLESVFNAQEFLAEATGSLERSSRAQKRSILFTAADSEAGSATVALNHAWLLATGGQRVILVDGDPRDPAVGRAAGVEPSPQIEHVLSGSHPINEALVSVEAGGVKLRVFAIDERSVHGFPIWMPMGRHMIAELLQVADSLVVAAPPLGQSARALALARSADSVVVVVQIGQTPLAELRELGELFARQDVRGAGIVLIGAGNGSGGRSGLRAGRERAIRRASRFRLRSGTDDRRETGAADNGAHALANERRETGAADNRAHARADGAAQRPRRVRHGRERLEPQ